MDVGKRVRQLREAAGLSQNELAKRAGVGQSTLSYIELGEKNPTVDTVIHICSALGVTLAEFFDLDSECRETVPEHLRPLLNEARNLTPEQIMAIAEFIKAMKT